MDNNQYNFFPLSLAFLSNFMLALLFLFFINPETMDADYNRGLAQFIDIFGGHFLQNLLSVDNTAFFISFILILSSLVLIFILFSLRLIHKNVLYIYLIFPYSAYLMVKVKLEFFVIILTLIKLDMSIKNHILVILFLSILMVIFRENNLLILIAFRVSYILMSKINYKVVFSGALLFALSIDYFFDLVTTIVPQFKIFLWTRDTVNPEYSIIETVAVFVSSFHLSMNPAIDWPYHMMFSFPLGVFLTFKLIKKYAIVDKKALFSFVAVNLFFTSLTHAYQNARYYFFYIHLLPFLIVTKKEFVGLLLWGWVHAIILIIIKNNIIS